MTEKQTLPCLALWPSPDGSSRVGCEEGSMIQQSAFLSASPKQALEVPHYGHCVLLLQRAARICGSNLKKKKRKR